MPELPDITLYLNALEPRIVGQPLEEIRVASPFVVRTYDPPLEVATAKRVLGLRRLGKRVVMVLEENLYLVFHLMIAGRFRWRKRGARTAGRVSLAAFDFPTGTLLLTEASSNKRASLHLVRGEETLARFDAGGIEMLESDLASFREVFRRENHTLKRSLTDPRLLSGIGNAYSDEILHRAGLSPLRWSRSLKEDEVERLYRAIKDTLREWIHRLEEENGDGFPEKVTAFREGMAVHGRYRKPCPVCGHPVQRIVYAANETNYCAQCQTGGKILADRALSRLLKGDWPRTLEEFDDLWRGDAKE